MDTAIDSYKLKDGSVIRVDYDMDASAPTDTMDFTATIVLPGMADALNTEGANDELDEDAVQAALEWLDGDPMAALAHAADNRLDADDLHEAVTQLQSPGVFMPIYAYEHGGIMLSPGPFSCPWDSGQAGYAYITADVVRDEFQGREGQTRRLIQGEVEIMSNYANGDVFAYVVEDAAEEIIDSCAGFYGLDDIHEHLRIEYGGEFAGDEPPGPAHLRVNA